eukprot:1008867-Lingulodinium_polyedra.AAC.1
MGELSKPVRGTVVAGHFNVTLPAELHLLSGGRWPFGPRTPVPREPWQPFGGWLVWNSGRAIPF